MSQDIARIRSIAPKRETINKTFHGLWVKSLRIEEIFFFFQIENNEGEFLRMALAKGLSNC